MRAGGAARLDPEDEGLTRPTIFSVDRYLARSPAQWRSALAPRLLSSAFMQELNERTKLLYRPVNDVGGLPRDPLNLSEHPLQPWEKRCHALLETLNARGVLTMEEKRRGIEDMGQTIYAALTYYEKWAMCAANVLMTKGHFTPDELADRLAGVRRRFEEGT
jgi:hypothetical protein